MVAPRWPVLTEEDYRKVYGDGGNLSRLWGLPSDYDKLPEKAKRAARIAIVMDHSTPERFTAAFDLFCSHYLQRDHTDYKKLPRELQFYRNKKPPALIHHMMIDWVKRFPYNLAAIPRHFGKSAIIGMALPLFLALTKPGGFKVLYVCNSDGFVKDRFSELMLHLESNPLITADFGPQKPPRGGDSIWTKNQLTLLNRNKIIGMAIGARVLGIHPDLAIIDDAEQDPDDPTAGLKNSDRLAAQLDNYIFSTLMPSLDPGDGIFWIGTLISKRNYIYHAAYSKERKWNFWSRAVYGAIDDRGTLLWKEKFSESTIDSLRHSLGSKFGANVMNRPGEDSDRVLFIDPEFNQYSVIRGPHPKDVPLPLECRSSVRYAEMGVTAAGEIEPIWHEEAADEWFGSMYRFITVDYARAKHARADYSVVMVMGRDAKSRIWVLDLWAGRIGLDKGDEGLLSEDALLNRMWAYAVKWRVHTCCIESVAVQDYIRARAQADLKERMKKHKLALNVVGTKYPQQMSKHDRICNALEWRFIQNMIFLPVDLKKKWPFNMLYAQIRDATRDGSRLKHDDCVDALAQQHYMPGNQPQGKWEVRTPKARPVDQMRRGMLRDPKTGELLASCLLPHQLTPELVDRLTSARKADGFEDDYDEDEDGDRHWFPLAGL